LRRAGNPGAIGSFFESCLVSETPMDEIGKLLEHLGYATPLLYATTAYGVFAWLDNNASDEAKAALANTMKLQNAGSQRIASALVEVFDGLYTHPLFRWRAVGRSVLFTVVVSIVFVIEFNRPPMTWSEFKTHLGNPPVLVAIVMFFATNALTDYISLFIIRPWLNFCGARPVLALVTGTLLGALVVNFGALLRLLVLYAMAIAMFGISQWSAILVNVKAILPGTLLMALPAVVVFAWLPLFASGIVASRIFGGFSWIIGKAQWALKDGKEHPLKVVGYVAAAIVFFVFVGWQIVSSAFLATAA
jgi:hypothetical protein